jgi:hypothetical protein
MEALHCLTTLRAMLMSGLSSGLRNDAPDSALSMRQNWRLCEIRAEEYAFVLLSSMENALEEAGGYHALAEARDRDWALPIGATVLGLRHMGLSGWNPSECIALENELAAWQRQVHAPSPPHLTPSPHLTSPPLISSCLISPHLSSPHPTSSLLIPPHLTSPHTTSFQSTSFHITSPHLILSPLLTSCHIFSSHLTSHHLISSLLNSSHLTSHYLTSHHLISHQLISPHLISLDLISPQLTSPLLTSSHPTSHLTSPHFLPLLPLHMFTYAVTLAGLRWKRFMGIIRL